jgi:FAD synthase
MALIQKIGVIPASCAVVVGAWDPLFPEVEKCLRRLARTCATSDSYRLLPVLIDPPPAAMLHPGTHPRFECAEARLARILDCGVDGAIRLRLSKKDLEQGIEFLLDLLGRQTEVRCVFLGKFQSLGSAGRGDPRTIRRVCAQRGIEVLPSDISVIGSKRTAYRLFRRNAFVQLADLLGRPLSWTGHIGTLRVPLKPGTYRAKVSTSNPSLTSSATATVELHVDASGQVRLVRSGALDAGDPVWIAPTRFVRRTG